MTVRFGWIVSSFAEYHGVPAAYLAKHLQSLARAGLVETTKGPRGGYPARAATIGDGLWAQ